MSNAEKIFIRVLTAFFFGVTAFLIVGIFLWFYPREIINLDIKTQSAEVKTGGTLVVDVTSDRKGDAQSKYTSTLVCGATRYLLLELDVSSQKQSEQTYSSYGYNIPEYVTPSRECRIEVRGSHEIEILPLLTRTYSSQFVSNIFEVTK